MTQELTLHFCKSEAWNISGSGASTSDYTFVFILGLVAILLAAFLIYKRKNKALLCIPLLLSVICIGFAYGANTCLSLIDKDVLKFNFIAKEKVKVTLLNVDESKAGEPVYINKGETYELPNSATPPPRTAPDYWDFDGWHDKNGNAIDMSIPLTEDITVYAHYKDKVVPLQENYSISNFMTKGKRGGPQQGCDIYNGLIFSGEDGGHVNVYKFSDGDKGDDPVDPIGGFELASSEKDNHVNNIEFGLETKPGASYPLMYISNGKVGSKIEFVCYVESISEKDGAFKSELAQTIWIEENHRDTWRAKGYIPIFGAPSWMIDRTRGDLWIFSAYQRTTPQITTANWQNEYIATKFRLPKLSDGENITLTADDILDQAIFPYETCFTQAGYMIDGKIYYCFGVGNTNDLTRPPRIRIYDTNTKRITTGYNLDINMEPEDIFIKDGFIYLNTNADPDPRIFKISMPKE
ncbi:MAG: hypothetical protein Q4E88_03110 [Coriobacteriia bacterium]|nr:hypothetical protein [Coriobacteriia bacterium]